MAQILILCSRTPYPLTGGAKLRLFNTAKILQQEHTVDLLIIDEGNIDASRIQKLESEFNNVTLFSYPQYRFYLNTIPGLISKKPLQTFYFSFDEIEEWVNRNIEDYDLAYCNHIRTTEYVLKYDIPKVVDFVDAISRNYSKSGENAKGIWRTIYPLEARRLLSYERRITEEFDHSFIITKADKEYIEESQEYPSLTVLPNGVKSKIIENEPFIEAISPSDPKIVFQGKMDYFPNIDAATYFAKRVFPQVRNQFPNAQFIIVGINPTEKVRQLEEQPGIRVTGFVDDPTDYLKKAQVVVAPMRYGAGLQNKVIEAMGLGKPVVTTPLGQEGIDAEDGKHLCIGENNTAIAKEIMILLEDESKRRYIGQHARTRIENQYTWDLIKPMLLRDINRVLNSEPDKPANIDPK